MVAILLFCTAIEAELRFGAPPGCRISLFSEDSSRWMIADQGIQLCGAVGAVSCDAAQPELYSARKRGGEIGGRNHAPCRQEPARGGWTGGGCWWGAGERMQRSSQYVVLRIS